MRKAKIILFFTLLTVSKLAAGQRWCPQGAEWTYNFSSQGAAGYARYSYVKDTIVQSQACKKLNGILVYEIYSFYEIDTTLLNPLFTYSRNDTVFFLDNAFSNTNISSFYPVYYFNRHIGDTIVNHNSGCVADSLLQQEIYSSGSVTVNSATLLYYKAVNVNVNSLYIEPDSVTVVEKLGAIDNFLIPFFACYTDGDSYTLRCYSDDSLGSYQVAPFIPCDYVLSVNDYFSAHPLKVYPNPSENDLNIHLPASSLLTIYNPLGVELFAGKEEGRSATIDISAFPKGIYFINVQSGNTVKQAKFVKD